MRTVAKHSYIRTNVAGTAKRRAQAHIRYIEFRGREEGERPRQFFNSKRDDIRGEEVRADVEKQTDRGVVMHKLILSPGLNNVDLHDYTRELLEELGRSKGLDLDYYATIHKNTEHEHVHVVIMGRDLHGREVWIDGKNDYKMLRDMGDRYMEKHHDLDRYLDREIAKVMEKGYLRDIGDERYEDMLRELRGEEPVERKKWSKDEALTSIPEREKIEVGGQVYTRYNSAEELHKLDEQLRETGRQLSKDESRLLWSWIGQKDRYGDEYHERQDKKAAEELERVRLQQQFDDDLKRMLREQGLKRPMGRRQFMFESQGRLLDSHERYQIGTTRQRLLEEQKDPELSEERAKEIEKELEWLDELSRDNEPRRPVKSEDAVSAEKKKDEEHEEPRKTETREDKATRDDGQEDGAKEKEEQDRQSAERERQDQEAREREQEDERREQEREREERQQQEQAKLTQEERERLEREQRELEDRGEREESERQRLEEERQEREREEQEERERSEAKRHEEGAREEQRKAQEQAKEEAERLFRLQQEAERLRHQQLEPGREGAARQAPGEERRHYEHEVEKRSADLDNIERSDLERADGTFDVHRDIEQNWGLEEKLGQELDELERSIDALDHEAPVEERSEQEKVEERGDEQSEASDVPWFLAEEASKFMDYEKLPEEERMLAWERDAYDPEKMSRQQEEEHEHVFDPTRAFDEAERTLEETRQQQEQQMAVDLHIQKAFFDGPRDERDEDEHAHDERGR